jgi:8-oxo-dGTP pyrophosphatase MutT (NUDIX family)
MNDLISLIKHAFADNIVKAKFIDRVRRGEIYKTENPEDHICVFFCVYDSKVKRIFIGKHISSGLWLVNGGHMEVGENFSGTFEREFIEEFGLKIKVSEASKLNLLTISKVINLNKQRKCKLHYDYWYFVPVDSDNAKFDDDKLKTEYTENKWVSIVEAKALATHKTTINGINFIESKIFNQ